MEVLIGDRTFRSGDGVLISASVTLAEGERGTSCDVTLYDRDDSLTRKYFGGAITDLGFSLQGNTSWSTQGSPIAIGFGWNGKIAKRYTFIHTDIAYDRFSPKQLSFSGQCAAWLLTQKTVNTSFEKISFGTLVNRLVSPYGISSQVDPNNVAFYKYIPLRDQNVYEAIVKEARRLGLRIYCSGNKIKISVRRNQRNSLVLDYFQGMGTTFSASYKAQTDSEGGALSSTPSNRTVESETQYDIDDETGEVVSVKSTGGRSESVGGTVATPGSPLPVNEPVLDKKYNRAAEVRREYEKQLYGIEASWAMGTDRTLLTLEPDQLFVTRNLGATLDRVWIVESLSHELSTSGFNTRCRCFSPLLKMFN